MKRKNNHSPDYRSTKKTTYPFNTNFWMKNKNHDVDKHGKYKTIFILNHLISPEARPPSFVWPCRWCIRLPFLHEASQIHLDP